MTVKSRVILGSIPHGKRNHHHFGGAQWHPCLEAECPLLVQNSNTHTHEIQKQSLAQGPPAGPRRGWDLNPQKAIHFAPSSTVQTQRIKHETAPAFAVNRARTAEPTYKAICKEVKNLYMRTSGKRNFICLPPCINLRPKMLAHKNLSFQRGRLILRASNSSSSGKMMVFLKPLKWLAQWPPELVLFGPSHTQHRWTTLTGHTDASG